MIYVNSLPTKNQTFIELRYLDMSLILYLLKLLLNILNIQPDDLILINTVKYEIVRCIIKFKIV